MHDDLQMGSISVPANFGLEFLRLKTSDLELKLKDDKTLKANAVILALNSHVVRDQIIAKDNLTLDFRLFDKEPVNLFLAACYQGRLDTLNKKYMSQVHLISHEYHVYWIIDAVFEDFRARVKRCAELAVLDYESAEFLFKEAVQVHTDTRKRNFIDVFMQQFGRVPDKRKGFLDLFCKKMLMEHYSEEELKIAVEMSGSELESVISAMVYHLIELKGKGKGLDDNIRCLLENINFAFLKEQNAKAHKELFQVIIELSQNIEPRDFCMIMQLSNDKDNAQFSTSWDRNTSLPNLLLQPLESPYDSRYDEAGNSNDEDKKNADHQSDLQGLKEAYESELLITDEENICIDFGNLSVGQVESSSDDEFYESLQYSSDCDPLSHPYTSLDTATTCEETEDINEEEYEQSTDSSNSDVVDTAEFKGRMLKLFESAYVCNLYMFIEDLWYWILDEGERRLDIDFTETMEMVKNIRIYRGWFPVSCDFVKMLDNPTGNKNLEEFRKALESEEPLICAHSVKVLSEKDHCISTMLLENEGTVAFQYRPPEVTFCERRGYCGFLLKATVSKEGQFQMKMCYAERDYKSSEREYKSQNKNFHHHDNLIFAQRMHVMLTSWNGPRLCGLSWEGAPVLDGEGQIVQWGRHRFTGNTEPQASGKGYNYTLQSSDKPKFVVFYCTD